MTAERERNFEQVDEMLVGEGAVEPWELFHENSKTSRYERHPTFVFHPSDTAVVSVMNRLRTVKPYRDREKVELPLDVPRSTRPLDDVLLARETARSFGAGHIPLDALSKVLLCSYGLTRDNEGTHYPRPFRAVPSGGALYPLELYVCAPRVDGLARGLYHYDPEEHTLDVLRLGDEPGELTARLFVQNDLAEAAAAIVFVSAVFVRATFKYGARGYRFVLLEAGHVAQNATLVAQELGWATAVIGGYFDRDVDRYLRLDGIEESVVYVFLVGPR